MYEVPKYAAIEIERRWLVDLKGAGDLSNVPYREIEDLYLSSSRLRLRKVSAPGTSTIFKFGKKYGKRTAVSEPVTNLYLTETEYLQLSPLPGTRTLKRRYSIAGGALDVYQRPREGLAVFEAEFDHEASAQAYEPPPFVTREITGESSFTGVSLSEAHAI